MKKFYRYLYYVDPRFDNCRYTPADILPKQSKLLGSVCKLTCELVPEDKYKDLGGGLKADWRYGTVEGEDAKIALLGWSTDDVIAQMVSISTGMALKPLTGEEMASELRKFTDFEEKAPGVFLVSPANSDYGIDRPEVVIDTTNA